MASKAVAKRPVLKGPHDIQEAADYVREIGEAQRAINGIEGHLNSVVERLRERAMERSQPHAEQIELLRDGLYAFAEAHRDELTESGKRKSVDVTTGTFGWRMTPPTVSLRNVKKIIAKLKELKLTRFIRVKEEVDKEAMLREPDVASGVKGVSIAQHEDFFIKPAELEVEIAADAEKLTKRIA